MTVDYLNLRRENERRYGTDIGRIGDMLLANRYDRRTHFIFELIQNAEDALRRRGEEWKGSTAVAFNLSDDELRISHYGQPFNEPDVRGNCGIDESTKDITSIGRFGIGFKSVYAFTRRPEIYSGEEAFAIESYVWPVAVDPVAHGADETVIILPLNADDNESRTELINGFENLGARALLFLRHVKEISWAVERGPAGLYLRGDPTLLDQHVREVTLLGEQEGEPDVEEKWLIFSREIYHEEKLVGYAEIAFALEANEEAIQPLAESPLVVFFPTVLQTHLGFLVQGPYRTTPSRDNVPPNERWNQQIARESGELLIDAIRWLAAHRRLDLGAFRALPLERAKFAGVLLEPLFTEVVSALKAEPLLPTADGGYVAATNARLSRSQELRDLFQPRQLASLLDAAADLNWLNAEITADRAPELRQFLMRELEVPEIVPEFLLLRLNKSFLEAQSDDWIVRLYGFLNNVPAIVARLGNVPLVRLEDGSHVPAFRNGEAQAFLPSEAKTEFPTVHRSICAREQAIKFLNSLGLTEPDPVDDVIRNLLPKYREGAPVLENYEADIIRIIHAFGTDSKGQREKLIAALIETPFVMSVDLGDGSKHVDQPRAVYLAAARLRELFADVGGIHMVDDSYSCLRGEDVRELLEACGATRYIYPTETQSNLSEQEKYELRRDAGHASITHEISIEDFTLFGLNSLLAQLPTLDQATRIKKAGLLWEALIELLERRGQRVFSGTYRWQYFSWWSTNFDSLFIRTLNQTEWIPDETGALQLPSFFLFEPLGWRPNPFLQSKIQFKEPIVEELAKEVGIEPAVLDMLKKLGLTSITELMAHLKVDGPVAQGADDHLSASTAEHDDHANEGGAIEDAVAEGDDGEDEPDEASSETANANGSRHGSGDSGGGRSATGGTRSGKSAPLRFISYVRAHLEEDASEADGLTQAERLALEQSAISLICHREPNLRVMPAGNEGFDLIEADAADEPERWVEVKAMKGSLEDRPVGLSHVQFEFARMHGEQYWLYIVEYANDPKLVRIVKIQNPAGRTGSFTFDEGWVAIADIDELLDQAC